MSWIVSLILPSLIGKALGHFGITGALAGKVTPRVLNIIREMATIAREAKAKGATDEQAALAAEQVMLRPQDRKVTIDDILKSENQQNV